MSIERFYDELTYLSSQKNYGHSSFWVVQSPPQNSRDLLVAKEVILDKYD
jgi:hypothetical protein